MSEKTFDQGYKEGMAQGQLETKIILKGILDDKINDMESLGNSYPDGKLRELLVAFEKDLKDIKARMQIK